MGNNVSLQTVAEKNKLASSVAFLFCIDVEIVDPNTGSIVEIFHLVNNTEDITVAGVRYVPMAFDVDVASESGGQPSVTLTCKDYTKGLMAFLQAYRGGVGSNVTLSVVNAATPAAGFEISEYFKIVGTQTQDYDIAFTLGDENALAKPFPRRKQTRDFCQWRYRDPQTCRYGLFPTFIVRSKANGPSWGGSLLALLDFDEIPEWDNDYSLTFSVYARPDSSRHFGLVFWNGRLSYGRAAYFRMTLPNNDFVVDPSGIDPAVTARVYPPNDPSMNGWHRLSIATSLPSGEKRDPWYAAITPDPLHVAGQAKGIVFGGAQVNRGLEALPLVRTNASALPGNMIQSSDNPMNSFFWLTNDLVDLYNVSNDIQSPSAGGLPSCDLTLRGPNGCAAHNNVINFGGFPGIRSGRM